MQNQTSKIIKPILVIWRVIASTFLIGYISFICTAGHASPQTYQTAAAVAEKASSALATAMAAVTEKAADQAAKAWAAKNEKEAQAAEAWAATAAAGTIGAASAASTAASLTEDEGKAQQKLMDTGIALSNAGEVLGVWADTARDAAHAETLQDAVAATAMTEVSWTAEKAAEAWAAVATAAVTEEDAVYLTASAALVAFRSAGAAIVAAIGTFVIAEVTDNKKATTAFRKLTTAVAVAITTEKEKMKTLVADGGSAAAGVETAKAWVALATATDAVADAATNVAQALGKKDGKTTEKLAETASALAYRTETAVTTAKYDRSEAWAKVAAAARTTTDESVHAATAALAAAAAARAAKEAALAAAEAAADA